MYRKITMVSVPQQYKWPNKIQKVSRTQTFFETYRHEIHGLLIFLLICAAFAGSIFYFFNFGITEKVAARAINPEMVRTDIKAGDTVYVQRGEAREFRKVVGLPGDTVQIQNGAVLVNGTPVEAKASYVDAIMLLNGSSYFAVEDKTTTVPHNPANSIYKQEQIIGRIPQSSP